MIRADCIHFLMYGGRAYCKLIWRSDIRSEPMSIDLREKGCEECDHFETKDGKPPSSATGKDKPD